MVRDLVALAVAGGIAVLALQQSADLNPEAAVFPRTIAMAMAVLVVLAIGRVLLTRHVTEYAIEGSWARMVALPIVMLAAVFLFPIVGFAMAAVLMGLVLAVVAQHDRFTGWGWAILLVSVAGIILGCTFLFSEVLSVPLP